ncbi:signal recognition particle-docking protein FtsY [Paraglaciecola sp.]|uniref:signal recognition particle-docking protein FtsY n=1 Tax=Paraglaciecola sp. TaxID=1920173 RepID=UPI0030F3F332
MSKFFSWLNKDKSKNTPAEPTEQLETPNLKEELPQPEPEEVALTDETLATSASPTPISDNAADKQVEVAESLPPESITTAVQTSKQPSNESSFFSRLKRGLSRTTENLGNGLVGLFRGKNIDDELFEELETQLLISDVGIATTSKMVKNLTESANRKQLRDSESLFKLLKSQMVDILSAVDKPLIIKSETKPFVILMVGVNGVGKTTTIGKMAKQFQQQGKKVMLAAGDTFRAAAVEQLQVWGERNNIPVVAQQSGADSASVIFDAFQSAKAKNIDILIADTAGRLQNKDHLMEELKKVVRVIKKIDPQAPHEIMLTLDAGTGQNAVSQTNLFHQAVSLTGLTLTKLDGTAKGGVIFAIADQFPIPIRYIGVGEGIDDLRPFNSQEFVDALFAESDKQVSKQQHH